MVTAADTGNLAVLWPAAGILVAFQTAVLTLRINREIEVGKQQDTTWLPLADWLNILSILATLLGVFAARALNIGPPATAVDLFGVSALLLAGYPIALAGHYDMLNHTSTRSMQFCTFQEIAAISLVGCASVGVLIWIGAAPGIIVIFALAFLLIAVYGWRFVAHAYFARRKDRAETLRLSEAWDEITDVLHKENLLFAEKLMAIQRRYNAILDEIQSTSEEETSRRKLLRIRKQKVFEELLEWETDVQQIQADLDLLFNRQGREAHQLQASDQPAIMVTGAQLREYLRRRANRRNYSRYQRRGD